MLELKVLKRFKTFQLVSLYLRALLIRMVNHVKG